jgi:hypothetical protein
VLDQEDLIAQGIDTSVLIPGAQKVDALGSCTSQANTSGLSNVLPTSRFLSITGASSYTDTVGAEKFAITFYHECTDQTGDPSQEWPPTDCGSSGPYVVSEDKRLGYVTGEKIAHGADNIVSLLQTGGLMMGTPWMQAWFTPDANGFIDGDGSVATVQAQLRQVAGGHEIYLSAIEKLVLFPHGDVNPWQTIVRFRNSWSKSWGDNGSFRAHLSTFSHILAGYVDFRQLVV